MMQASYTGNSPTGTYTGQPNKAQVLDLIKGDKDLRNEFKTLISESIRNEFIKIRGEIASAQQQAQVLNAQQQQATSTQPAPVQHVFPPANIQELLLKEFPAAELSKWSYLDEKGSVYGFPETIDVDVIKQGNNTFLCNIKEVITLNIILI
jgi:hypothetical protein